MPSSGRDWKRHVPGSRRHVHEHEIHIAPFDIRPELFDSTSQDRAAPYHRVGLIGQQQVQGHQFDAGIAYGGNDAFLVGDQLSVDAECFWNRWSCDIRIQNCHGMTAAAHQRAYQGGHQGFAHTALAADDSDNLFHMAVRIGRRGENRLLTSSAGTVLAAIAAIVITILAHLGRLLSFPGSDALRSGHGRSRRWARTLRHGAHGDRNGHRDHSQAFRQQALLLLHLPIPVHRRTV